KVAALVAILVVNAVAHIARAVVGGGILLSTAGLPPLPDAGALAQTCGLMTLILIVSGLIGLGLRVLSTTQVAALFLGIAVTLIVEPLVALAFAFFDGVDVLAKYFPSQATTAALSVFDGVDPALAEAMGAGGDQLSWWAGAVTLLCYAVV